MKIKLELKNVDAIANRVINDDVKLFANTTLYKLCDPYVPFREGGLSQNVDVAKDYIHYKSPYAEKVYNGKDMNFNTDKHPLATAEWDKVAMVSKKEQLVNSVENYIKRKG